MGAGQQFGEHALRAARAYGAAADHYERPQLGFWNRHGAATDGFPNGSMLVAASAAVAVAASDLPGGSLIRTTDSGVTWTVVQRLPTGPERGT
jgi:hypothetical protein